MIRAPCGPSPPNPHPPPPGMCVLCGVLVFCRPIVLTRKAMKKAAKPTKANKAGAGTAKAHTELTSAAKAAKLAENPKNVVYEYTYDKPERELPPGTQMANLRDIVTGFDAACRRYPAACDEALREMTLEGHDDLRLFQRLCPKLFASCTVRALDADMEERLDKCRKMAMYMLMEKCRTDGGTDEEREARAMFAGMRLSMTELTPEVAASESSVRLDASMKTAGIQPEAMKPMSRYEMGESTVHQS